MSKKKVVSKKKTQRRRGKSVNALLKNMNVGNESTRL